MGQVLIEGVPVSFPYDLYDCQLEYLKVLIKSLQQGKNALLESPTGTGKTLCMLCGVLGWREALIAKLQLQRLTNSSSSSSSSSTTGHLSDSLGYAVGSKSSQDSSLILDIPKIFYASRTHSQLNQVIRELKKTCYKPKLCLLTSREQCCIHPEISKIPQQTVQNALCRRAVAKKQCQFRTSFTTTPSNSIISTVDIMDIEELVNYGRAHKTCPYWLSRDNLEGADIVLLPYNYLFNTAMRESQGISLVNSIVIVDEAHNLEGHCMETSSTDISQWQLGECVKEVGEIERLFKSGKFTSEFEGEHFKLLERVMRKSCDVFSKLTPSSHPGSMVGELMMKEVGLEREVGLNLLQLIEEGVSAYSISYPTRVCHLDTWATFLKAIWRGSTQQDSFKNYYFHVRMDDKQKTKVFGYWCMNPGLAINELLSGCKVRNLILTSGTLSPMDSFATELQVNFPFQLENGHVIFREQLMVGIVPIGPTNLQLNSSFANRTNVGYKRELGNSILGVLGSIPAGIIVFFASYSLMEDCITNWKGCSIWSQMEEKKKVFVEPRDKNQFSLVVRSYCEASTSNSNSRNGAILFAICRGKASEGIDFRDGMARAVIITGIPYPSLKDAKVELKRKFVDSQGKRSFSGSDWYGQQASRAINQAIGRVIRHRNDYGAILLFDEKFSLSTNISCLSLWLRERAQIYPTFSKVPSDLSEFYKINQTKMYSSITLNATNKKRKETVDDTNSKIFKNNNSISPIDLTESLCNSPIVSTSQPLFPFLKEEPDKRQERIESKMKAISTLFSNKLSSSQDPKLPTNSCPICNSTVLTDPLIANCQHSCCSKCWDIQFKKAFQCPSCSTRTRPSHLRSGK